MSGFDMLEYREMFAEEASEIFDDVDSLLLEAESSGRLDDEQMNTLFRGVHTLKGSGASVELIKFSGFAHHAENLMDELRNHKIEYHGSMAPFLIDCMDTLKAMLTLETNGDLDDDMYNVLIGTKLDDIKVFLEGQEATVTPKEEISPVEESDNFGFFDDVKPDEKIEDEPLQEKKVEPVPAADQKSSVKPGTEQSSSNNKPAVVKKEAGAKSSSNIRVNLDKIDTLMNGVGDLVITNAMLTQFAAGIDDSRVSAEILEKLEHLDRHIRAMQDSVMSIRMVPMESVYSKFPKIIRDLSKSLDKKVNFTHTGDSVEIDKAMIEGLTDPLVHIIRNSLDHGLESPEERVALGKNEVGSISIGAEQSNGQMIISIEDDGAGIDVDNVVQKAIEKGMLDEDQANLMSDNEKAMLIFGAGLSTAEEVTSVSGRGVGMDVVKANITKLGGVIKVDTQLGVGTAITIVLPLTLAILDGLDITIGNTIYILPLNSIIESIQPSAAMIKKVGDGEEELLILREEFIPIVRLSNLFNIETNITDLTKGMLIVVKAGSEKVAIFVDKFLNQQQVVVKPIDKNFNAVPGIGAATVRGDGSIGLILDVLGIIDLKKESYGEK